jgi:hypothetical protein
VSQRLLEHVAADDATLTLVKDGDHRLSRPDDIARMLAVVDALADQPPAIAANPSR